MAKSLETIGNNFAATDPAVTRYLDIAGLLSLWTKVKDYADTQDSKLFETVKTKVNDNDAALRSYLESLTINGTQISSNKTKDALGTSLEVEIGGEEIKVNHNGGDAREGEKYADYIKVDGVATTDKYTVRTAFADVDDRLDAVEDMLDNIVNDIEVVDTPNEGDATTNYVKTTLEWSGTAASGTRKAKITVDETNLDNEINIINEKIVDLQANAGVTNIGVKDVDGDTPNLVSIKLTGTKANTLPENEPTGWNSETNGSWADYKKNFEANSRGDVLITLDETALEDRLDANDTRVTNEIADRKADIAKLAGDGYTVYDSNPEDGKTVVTGSWSDNVFYKNITDISERLSEIDDNLVTEIVDGNGEDVAHEKYVDFTVTSNPTGNAKDNKIILTLNDTKLQDYIASNNSSIEKLEETTINGYNVYEIEKVTDADGYETTKVTPKTIVLDTTDINRDSDAHLSRGGETIEESFARLEDQVGALISATEFKGVVDWNPATVTVEKATADAAGVDGYWIKDGADYVLDETSGEKIVMQNGDIVITEAGTTGNKEYILDGNHLKFVELGDVTAEQARLTAIEDWINKNFILEADIVDIFDDLGITFVEGKAIGGQNFTF